MTIRSRAARLVAATGLTVALLGLAAPAQAEQWAIDDPADATASLNDIYGVAINHGKKKVKFHIRVDDLRRVSSAGATLFLDTDPGNKGPEYALATGLSSGTDYALLRVKGFASPGTGPVKCKYALELRYRADVVKGFINRGCLGKPDTVAASVKMVDHADASHPVRDWAPAKKKFGLPVAKG